MNFMTTSMSAFGNWFILLLIHLGLSSNHVVASTNDPELLQQLWNQLYRFLPGPSVAPKLPSELSINVDLSVSVDSVELHYVDNRLICRASLTILSEWPVTDARVADSRLIELIQGGVRLEVERVWHPELAVVGGYRVQKQTQRLELRTDHTPGSDGGLATSQVGTNAGRTIVAGSGHSGTGRMSSAKFSQHEMLADSPSRPSGRRDPLKTNSRGEGPHFALIESYSVEVVCSRQKKFSHLGAVLCPIWFRQEGTMKTQPAIRWAERKSCLLSEDVKQTTTHVTLAKIFGSHIDKKGPDHNLGINLCFSQTGRAIHGGIIPLLVVCISLILLWNGPLGTRETSWLQMALLLLISGQWFWIAERFPSSNGLSGPIDIWCLICFMFVLGANFLSVIHERWVYRIVRRQRRRRLTHVPSLNMLQNKGPGGVLIGTAGSNPVNGCFQGCSCGSSSGTCLESCINCSTVPGRASGAFLSAQNGPNTVYCSNSSCGAPGHACNGTGAGNGLNNLPGVNTANNSPAPMGFTPQSIGLGTVKMDPYSDGFLCSANSDNGNGGMTGTFRGLRWRNGAHNRRVNGPCVGLVGLDISECHACSCPLSPSQMHNTTNHPSGSPVPPYTSICSSISYHLPTSCCMTTVKTVLAVLYVLVTCIFWISVLSQGTIPDACLGASTCQTIPVEYLK
ncbi:hypothetical protein EG68_01584 [Paragonimus skrjabini miyazakii]|uniref:Uncharacterized protein n=1 Tax=Paragonimus skrjabini miyazakii TaxID=59628 RepID=A0A8S9ZAP5_9TREM|nr:hypothetical protein EG68_01584 [Paragonimus skrjabini miyazakii]